MFYLCELPRLHKRPCCFVEALRGSHKGGGGGVGNVRHVQKPWGALQKPQKERPEFGSPLYPQP